MLSARSAHAAILFSALVQYAFIECQGAGVQGAFRDKRQLRAFAGQSNRSLRTMHGHRVREERLLERTSDWPSNPEIFPDGDTGLESTAFGYTQGLNSFRDAAQCTAPATAQIMQLELRFELLFTSNLRCNAQLFMSKEEVRTIETFLDKDDVMLEYGSGRSTLWFSQFVKAYYSIEHTEEWYNQISTELSKIRHNVTYELAKVDPGHKGWKGGFEEGTEEQFSEYVKAVDNFKVLQFDKVLVDGRARAPCAEYVLKYLHAKSLVFIHDYQERTSYHTTAEKYYTKVAETYEGQTLVVLRPKPEALRTLFNL